MTLYTTDKAVSLGKGQLSPEGSVTDSDLASLFLNYKRGVASRYIAATSSEIDDLVPRGDLHVSKKVDGQIWYAVLEKGDAFLASPKGKVISGDHPLVAELKEHAKSIDNRAVVAGELYAVGDNDRIRCGDIAKSMGGGKKAQVERMRFAAFDYLAEIEKPATDDKDESADDPFAYGPRLEALTELFGKGELITCVTTEVVSGTSSVRELYEKWVKSGEEEGLVVRSAKQRPIKIKPDIHIDAVVIGYTIRREDPEQCSSMLLGLMRPDGMIQELGSCGNLGEAEQRKEFLATLSKLDVESKYRRASSSGALYRFIKPSLVVEIKATDIQPDNASGDPIRRMVLEYDEGAGWKRLRKMPVASMLHPVFVRMRDDKSVNETDIRMSQLDEHIYVRDSEARVEELKFEKSKVLRREVYSKASKGKTMVRKLVMWKSNKEQVDAAYAPFVVHFTDYSSGRKDPLKREVRLAGTEEKASAIADAMIAKNIKKGWQQVGG
jgi:ATP-dependent DNA ligase